MLLGYDKPDFFFSFTATDVIFRRPDAFARPRSFHFLFKAVHKENKEHHIRCVGIHRCPQLLVVQRSCFWNPWTYR